MAVHITEAELARDTHAVLADGHVVYYRPRPESRRLFRRAFSSASRYLPSQP